MYRASFLLAAAVIITGSAFSCDSGQSSNGDSGPDAAEGGVTFVYTPAGCQYTVTPTSYGLNPNSGHFNYGNGNSTLALDDTAAPSGDITPSLVRVGVGGGTDSSKPASYANPSTNAAFMWETPTPTNAAKVKMGTSPTTITDVHTGYSWIIPKGISTTTTNAHAVHVCGLSPGTTYYYQVGGGPTGSETWSKVQSFTTVPNTGTITVGVLGDARDKVATWQLVAERMLQAGVSAQLIPGDIVDLGALGDLWTTWLQAIWIDPTDATKFLTLGEQLMVPIAGNHEAESDEFYGNWVFPGEGQYAGTYSSFDIGNTHFVMIDDSWSTQSDFTQPPASTILQWLDGDLSRANSNRAKVPFIAVLSHRGLYSTSNHSTDGDVLAARGQLAPLYDKYNVDLAMNGHDHEYERSYQLKAGSPATGDPVVDGGTTTYVICAGAGADPYAVGQTAKPYSQVRVGFGTNSPVGTSYIGTYAILTLAANTLTLKAYGLQASGSDPVIDTFTLTH